MDHYCHKWINAFYTTPQSWRNKKTIWIEDIEENKTEVNYTVDLVIRGRLGQFGQGVIRATAKAITAIFVKCIREKIGDQP